MSITVNALGRVVEEDPEDVKPEDLIVGTRFPLAVEPALAPQAAAAEAAAQARFPLRGEDPNATGAVVAPPSPPASMAPLSLPAVPATAPAPVRRPLGGDGGVGGSAFGKQVRGDLVRAQDAQEKAAEQETQVDIKKAGIAEKNAQEQLRVREEAAARQAAIDQATDAEIAKKQGELDAETTRYKGMRFQDFWSRASVAGKPNTVTGARILGALSMALGAAGASLGGGRNYAMELIDKAIDRDYQQQRDTILKQKDAVTEARMGVEGARQKKADKLLSLAHWRTNAYEMAEKQGEAMLLQMGPAAAEAKGAKTIADIKAKKVESRLAVEQAVTQIADTKASTSLKYAQAARDREAAGKPGARASNPAIEAVSSLNADLEGMDRAMAIIKDNPKAWTEYQENDEKWRRYETASKIPVIGKIRGALQGTGAADIAPEQGLKTAGAKAVYQEMSKVLTSMAKGYGGVITEGDRTAAASALATLAQNPGQAVTTIARIRNNLATRKEMYLANNPGLREMVAPTAAPSQAGAAAPTGGATKTLRDPASGRVFTARQGPDGQWYEAQ